MSYVQGTIVRLQADFTDNETHMPTDPTEVILTIRRPDGVVTQHTLSGGQVQDDPDRVGRFFYKLDTSPVAGTWSWQMESTGNEAVVGRKELTVLSRLTAV